MGLQQQILSQTARVLSQEERSFYFDQGYVVKKRAIDQGWLDRLNGAMATLIDGTRTMTKSTQAYDLDAGHSSDKPRLRRIAYVDDLDPIFLGFLQGWNLRRCECHLIGQTVTL